jgi:hypothetical protein
MRESRTYGSVRGAFRKGCPYRNPTVVRMKISCASRSASLLIIAILGQAARREIVLWLTLWLLASSASVMPSNSGSVIEEVISVDADAGLPAAVRAQPAGKGARYQIHGSDAADAERVDESSFRSSGDARAGEPPTSLTAGPENRIGVLTSGPEQGSKLLKSHRARLAQRLLRVNVC